MSTFAFVTVPATVAVVHAQKEAAVRRAVYLKLKAARAGLAIDIDAPMVAALNQTAEAERAVAEALDTQVKATVGAVVGELVKANALTVEQLAFALGWSVPARVPADVREIATDVALKGARIVLVWEKPLS